MANRVIHDANKERHGVLAVTDILKYSSNIGAAKIAQKMGKEKFYDYIRNLVLGRRRYRSARRVCGSWSGR